MIIGLTSLLGAGKTSVADYLIKKGFEFYSLSDIIRDEIKSREQEITRQRLQVVGNELRKKYGNAVLAKRIIKKLEPGKAYVIDSIRNPAEIQVLRKLKGFTLVFIDAPIEIRFERIKDRKREQDPMTFEKFKKAEQKELESPDSANQQLLKCRDMAEFIITNNSSFEELYKKIDELLSGLK
ncbi:AAA family ATPase [Candidatus Woesearchaeota archaeon]|nr:AAA family ATPase [Candidatus Woesearchaeota archaeon]